MWEYITCICWSILNQTAGPIFKLKWSPDFNNFLNTRRCKQTFLRIIPYLIDNRSMTVQNHMMRINPLIFFVCYFFLIRTKQKETCVNKVHICTHKYPTHCLHLLHATYTNWSRPIPISHIHRCRRQTNNFSWYTNWSSRHDKTDKQNLHNMYGTGLVEVGGAMPTLVFRVYWNEHSCNFVRNPFRHHNVWEAWNDEINKKYTDFGGNAHKSPLKNNDTNCLLSRRSQSAAPSFSFAVIMVFPSDGWNCTAW